LNGVARVESVLDYGNRNEVDCDENLGFKETLIVVIIRDIRKKISIDPKLIEVLGFRLRPVRDKGATSFPLNTSERCQRGLS